MTSYNCSHEKVCMLHFCIEINIAFTGLLFHINSAVIYSLSPSKHISRLTLVSDSCWKCCIYTEYLSTYCCTYSLPVQLLTYWSSLKEKLKYQVPCACRPGVSEFRAAYILCWFFFYLFIYFVVMQMTWKISGCT